MRKLPLVVSGNTTVERVTEAVCTSCDNSLLQDKVVIINKSGHRIIICRPCVLKMCEKLWQLKMNLL